MSTPELVASQEPIKELNLMMGDHIKLTAQSGEVYYLLALGDATWSMKKEVGGDVRDDPIHYILTRFDYQPARGQTDPDGGHASIEPAVLKSYGAAGEAPNVIRLGERLEVYAFDADQPLQMALSRRLSTRIIDSIEPLPPVPTVPADLTVAE
ncbi:hypothetical protein HY380_02155 [Candidatus Saccharibacteria bacterium]|nr:hypothetical protein [Candidatus Saccharibacteria bacterium]